ncbi:unnamed protein product [Cyclocybe aegerita]|uniref:HNH nuclease domain-containing protein n=1 Tax=Cyclocybe aegerita TaxID=1973307 RepID=A0A8S0XSZ9_CYCAE|nr:unnamed protein product [Cyclocybe aegerita]
MVTPLPRPNQYNASSQFIPHTAYNRCLDLEDQHKQVSQHVRLDVLVCARFLGYMILEAPTDEGRMDVASEIVRCAKTGDIGLQDLAESYKNHFFRVFYSSGCRTPAPTHPSFYNKEEYVYSLSATAASHAKSKQLALERDDFSCVLTGKTDTPSIENDLVKIPQSVVPTVTRASHILNWSASEGLTDDNRNYAAAADAVLNRFGGIDVIKEFDGSNLHRLENILSLSSDACTWFSDSRIWLERDSQGLPNTYRPSSTKPSVYLAEIPNIISFSTPDPERLPLPDPRYLAVHVACARVAHMSGAAEYIHKVLRDMEETDVLRNDGPSDALYHALVRLL